jgi:uncharacterized membrane protein
MSDETFPEITSDGIKVSRTMTIIYVILSATIIGLTAYLFTRGTPTSYDWLRYSSQIIFFILACIALYKHSQVFLILAVMLQVASGVWSVAMMQQSNTLEMMTTESEMGETHTVQIQQTGKTISSGSWALIVSNYIMNAIIMFMLFYSCNWISKPCL